MNGRPGWEILGDLLARLARRDGAAIPELHRLAEDRSVDPAVARAAEDLGLLLVRLEGQDFLLDVARDAEARLRTMNELKNRHLGIAAHDLRNPLGAIRGLTRLISRGKVPKAKEASYLDTIVDITDQMLALLEHLLDVSVIESGRLQLDPLPGNLARLAQEKAERAAVFAREKGIEVDTDIAAVPDSEFDPVRMGQVVDNLLSNAVKFSPAGSRVAVGCRQVGDEVEIMVRDQGPGIPEEHIHSIFDPYDRAGPRPTGGEKSTGLGLSIARPIVEAHGGRLEVDSEVGRGTVFTVRIPVPD